MAKRNRSKKSKKEAQAYLSDFLDRYANDERVLRMKEYVHHAPITAYDHCLGVVSKCVDIATRLRLAVDWEALLLSALLHDYYLYPFQEHTAFHNCFAHPKKAAENAVALFDANALVRRAVRSHMFPAVPFPIPSSREAWIVSLADKMVAFKDLKKKKE